MINRFTVAEADVAIAQADLLKAWKAAKKKTRYTFSDRNVEHQEERTSPGGKVIRYGIIRRPVRGGNHVFHLVVYAKQAENGGRHWVSSRRPQAIAEMLLKLESKAQSDKKT
jgi:hypothetical protein